MTNTAELSNQVARLVRQIAALRAQVSTRQRHGVEWSAYVPLFHLVKDGAMRSSELADLVCADPSTVSRQVAALVELGCVERRSDPDDGRAVQLAATDRGHDLFRQMRDERDAMFAAVLVDWDDTDVHTLTALLERFTDDLERRRPRLLQDPTTPETS